MDLEPKVLHMQLLIDNIVEVVKHFPHIEAVCHEVDRGILSFVLCAPEIGLDEELELTQEVLDVFDGFDETDADFFVSSRPSDFYRNAGKSVILVR